MAAKAATTEALLQVRNLRTEFRTKNGILRAVDGVSFEVGQGETLGIVGESGSGKSVTAMSLMRLVPDSATVRGEVLFEGLDLLRIEEARVRELRGKRIAMIFQDPMTSLNPVMTVGRQIAEMLELHLGLSRKDARIRASNLLQLVGIPKAAERANDYPHQFSGGMRQRVMIAMALSCKPRLVVADEPTTALDVTIQAQILDLLKSLATQLKSAFILITHDLGVVAGMADRIHVMYAGRIVEKASTAELFADPRMPYTWGLLRSIPKLSDRRAGRLIPIEGSPPDLVDPPEGCRFEPRCPYARAICREKEPQLRVLPNAPASHVARCWGTQDVSEGGWLVGVDWRSEHDARTHAGITA